MAFEPQNALTQNIYDAIKAVLNANGVSKVFIYQNYDADQINYDGEAVVIVRVERRDTALQGGQNPVGWYFYDISLILQSYDAEDPNRAILNAMEKTVRDSFEVTEIETYMQAYSTLFFLRNWQDGGSTQDNEERRNILEIDYTWLIGNSEET